MSVHNVVERAPSAPPLHGAKRSVFSGISSRQRLFDNQNSLIAIAGEVAIFRSLKEL